MRTRLILALGIILLFAQVVEGKCGESQAIRVFEDKPWYKAHPAASHEPQSSVYFGKSSRMPYTRGPNYQTTMSAEVGFEVPIITLDGTEEEKPIQSGCWGAGAWFGIVIPLVLNLELPGQPVMGTDYMPSLRGKVAYGLNETNRLGFLIEYGHESSHATWDAVTQNFVDFDWLDKQYEYWRFGLDWEVERPYGTLNFRFQTLVASGQGHHGFYSTSGKMRYPSERNWVPGIGLQYHEPKKNGWGYFLASYVSADPVFSDTKEKGELEKIRVGQSYIFGLTNYSHRGLRIDPAINYYVGKNQLGVFGKDNTWRVIQAGFIIHK